FHVTGVQTCALPICPPGHDGPDRKHRLHATTGEPCLTGFLRPIPRRGNVQAMTVLGLLLFGGGVLLTTLAQLRISNTHASRRLSWWRDPPAALGARILRAQIGRAHV